MKRRSYETSAAFLVLFASGCQTGLPTDIIVDDTPPTVPELRVPPLSGGTLLVTRDDSTAVVSDPERDRILVVDLGAGGVRQIQLEPRDEPGRLVEGPGGTAFVALRGGGRVIALDLDSATVAAERAVCDAPRGLIYEESGSLHVACASGELVTLDAAQGLVETRRVHLGPDLRDVVKRGDSLFVTRFRSAELTQLDADGAPSTTVRPPVELDGVGEPSREPHVAWRTMVTESGEILMLHQTELLSEINLDQVLPEEDGATSDSNGSYGGECDSQPVHGELTAFTDDGHVFTLGSATMGSMRLPVDLAVSRDGSRVAMVDPATRQAKEVYAPFGGGDGCLGGDRSQPVEEFPGSPIAVAYAGEDIVVVQTREPAALHIFQDRFLEATIDLGGAPRVDTGFDLFHTPPDMARVGMACASCHPEGRDDGHVWTFSGEGQRRTQSLSGTLAGTAPFHWGGNLPTLGSLMDEVSTRRMGGVRQSPARVAALESWLLDLQPLRVAPDPVIDQQELIDQGEALFQDEAVGCASCHSGPSFTNNRNESVGRGAALQVPSLIGIGMRAPFMHDGCADTLMQRFEPTCGGDEHGDIEGLDDAQREALVAYMNTL